MNPAIFMVRVMQCAMIVSVLLFIFVIHIIHPAVHPVDSSVQLAIALCAVTSALLGFYLQAAVRRAPSRMFSNPASATPRGRWFTGHVIRFATAESVALFGFALRMIGSSSILVTLLFGSGLLLLFIWQPGSFPPLNEP
jgi:hypothetical protein